MFFVFRTTKLEKCELRIKKRIASADISHEFHVQKVLFQFVSRILNMFCFLGYLKPQLTRSFSC